LRWQLLYFSKNVAMALPPIFPEGAMKRKLTDRLLKSLKPASKDAPPLDIMDTEAPGLGVRVMGSPQQPVLTFILRGRLPGNPHPTRVRIGSYDELGLEAARDKAREWRGMIRKGRNPRTEEKRQREAELRKLSTLFGAVAEDFIKEKLPGERRGADVAREVRKEFQSWWDRPILDITRRDVLTIIRAKKEEAPASARNILGHIKRVFAWAIAQDVYEIAVSPAADINPKDIIGEKIARQRTLDDVEFRAFWMATDRLPYPQGPMFKLLALTGCRLAGVSEARWSEFSRTVRNAIQKRGDEPIDWSVFSPEDLWWTIPATRVKGRNSRAQPFMVPLTPDMLRILEGLPIFVGGDHLFSRNAGRRPAVVSTEIKAELDAKMLDALRELAEQRGDDPAEVELKPWVTHDLRRVVRSNLSRLRVPQEHAEACLGHVRPGIQGTYDIHNFYSEKRDALLKWNTLLRSIAEPAPAVDNVVRLHG
jgi:integrase